MGESIIPNNMSHNNESVNSHDISECFAGFFERKVADIVNSFSLLVFMTSQRKLYLVRTCSTVQKALNEFRIILSRLLSSPQKGDKNKIFDLLVQSSGYFSGLIVINLFGHMDLA